MGNQSLLQAIMNPLRTWARVNSRGPSTSQRVVQRLRHRDPGHADPALRPRTLRRQAPGEPPARRRADLHRAGDAAGEGPPGPDLRADARPEVRRRGGSCGISGGVFQGCYNIVGSLADVIPVNAFVPGCPPRPEAIIYGVVALLNSLKQPAPNPEGAEAGSVRRPT